MARGIPTVAIRPGYPPKSRPASDYFPYLATSCMVVMIIGVGVWIHYSVFCRMHLETVADTLDASFSHQSIVGRVFDGLAPTAAFLLILSTGQVALAAWRGMLEADQDILGQIPDNAVVYRWSSVVMQVAWGSFMVWMVVLLAGDSVLVGQLWTIKGIFTEVLAFRVITPQVPDHMLTTCPANCFDLNSLVFLEPNTITQSTTGCVCDLVIIQATSDLISSAYTSTSGIMAGIWLMYLGGLGLQLNMLYVLGKVSKELDIEARLNGEE